MSNNFLEKINKTLVEFQNELNFIEDLEKIEKLRLKYFSKNGIIDILTDGFKKLTIDEKKLVGSNLQDFKNEIYKVFEDKKLKLVLKFSGFIDDENFDPALDKDINENNYGSLHPYTLEIRRVNEFFNSMGFEIVNGPLLEEAEFNFNALNIPDDHPARDEMDTFWVSKEDGLLLRTHTSAVQVKEARKRNAPFGIISFGRVFRNEATDASHDFMFTQLEGLFISKEASLSNLLSTINDLFKMFFEKENLKINVRPGIFPFVEPGIEVDMECPFCENGCSTCKKTKWIEMGGAGMVHPNVLKNMNINDENVKGWAFGFGFTRLIMLKYSFSDIRNLHYLYRPKI